MTDTYPDDRRKFAVLIAWSEDADGFVASAPRLPGCTAYGYTRGEAATKIANAISRWIDGAMRENRPIPSP